MHTDKELTEEDLFSEVEPDGGPNFMIQPNCSVGSRLAGMSSCFDCNVGPDAKRVALTDHDEMADGIRKSFGTSEMTPKQFHTVLGSDISDAPSKAHSAHLLAIPYSQWTQTTDKTFATMHAFKSDKSNVFDPDFDQEIADLFMEDMPAHDYGTTASTAPQTPDSQAIKWRGKADASFLKRKLTSEKEVHRTRAQPIRFDPHISGEWGQAWSTNGKQRRREGAVSTNTQVPTGILKKRCA